MALRLVLCAALIAGGLARPGFADGSLRDPTRPPITTPLSTEGLEEGRSGESRVSSIMLSETRRIAIIDGRRVVVGDLVASGEITAIEAGAVHVEGPDGPRTLSLFQSPPTKTPTATTGGNP